MKNWKEIRGKLMNAQLTRSWQYLVYIYLVLPALLFVLAFISGSKTFIMLFHNYGLFVANPIINLSSVTGVVGLALAGFFLFWAVRRKDFADLAISTVLIAANAAYYIFELNYVLLRMLPLPAML